jgi:hypothetical protein
MACTGHPSLLLGRATMRRHAGWVLSVLISWGVPARAEPAKPKAAALSWIRLPGAERCPDLRTLAAQVEARLQRSAFVPPSQAQLVIEASAEPTPTKAWKIRIALSDDSGAALGTRELLTDSPNCAEAIDAAAIAIALMIDPDAPLGAGQPAPVPARDSPAPPPTNTPTFDELPPKRARLAPRDSSDAGRQPTPWRSRLSLGGMVALGVLPGVAPGVFGALRLSPENRRWGFDLALAYLPTEAGGVLPSRGTGSFSSNSGELLAWVAPWQRRSLSFSVAAGVEAASVSGTGSDFTSANRSAQSWLLSGRLELELSWRLTQRWSVQLRPGLSVPFWHDRFEAVVGGQSSTVFEPSPLAGSSTLALGFEP